MTHSDWFHQQVAVHRQDLERATMTPEGRDHAAAMIARYEAAARALEVIPQFGEAKPNTWWRLPRVVQAYHYFGPDSDKNDPALAQYLTRRDSIDMFEMTDEDGHFLMMEELSPGEWLCVASTGHVYAVPDREFRLDYEPGHLL